MLKCNERMQRPFSSRGSHFKAQNFPYRKTRHRLVFSLLQTSRNQRHFSLITERGSRETCHRVSQLFPWSSFSRKKPVSNNNNNNNDNKNNNDNRLPPRGSVSPCWLSSGEPPERLSAATSAACNLAFCFLIRFTSAGASGAVRGKKMTLCIKLAGESAPRTDSSRGSLSAALM